MKAGEQEDESRLVAFIVRTDQPVEAVYFRLLEPIAKNILEWRRNFGIGRGGGKDPGLEACAISFGRNFSRTCKARKPCSSRPMGLLPRFPWLALPGEKPGTYLIDNVAIATVPVPRMLPELLAPSVLAVKQPQSTSLLLVGDVDFGADPGKPPDSVGTNLMAARGSQPLHWQSLPGTRDEVAAGSRRHSKSNLNRSLPAKTDSRTGHEERGAARWRQLPIYSLLDTRFLCSLRSEIRLGR